MLKTGDHLLVGDNVYRPSQNFWDGLLTYFDIAISNFDPRAGATIEEPFKSNTKAVLFEALASPHFEKAAL